MIILKLMAHDTVRSRFRERARAPWLARLCLLIAVLGVVWLPCRTALQAEIEEIDRLRPDVPLERELTAGETHAFRLDLTNGETWRVSVEQLGVDVELALVSGKGERIVTDSPLDRAGTESLVVRADAGGFTVEVQARERAAPSGRYRILLQQLAGDTEQDQQRLAAETARMEAARLYAKGSASRPDALEHYQKAVVHWRAAGDELEETRDLYCVAVLQRLVGQTRTALESARGVLPRWQRLGDRYWEATTLNEIGLLLLNLDESREAREPLDRALSLRQALSDNLGAAKTHNNICLAYLKQGQLRPGLDCYKPLIETLNEIEEPQIAATVYTNIGWVNDTLGEPDAAFSAYRRALVMTRAADDSLGTAKILNNLGLLHRRLGEFEDALASYEKALQLFRNLYKPRWQGQVLNNIGYTYTLFGEPRRALVFLDESLSLHRKVGDRRREVWTLTNLGLAQRYLGSFEEAFRSYRKALALSAKIGDPRLEAMALTTMGLADLEDGDGLEALNLGTRALKLVQGTQARTAKAEALNLVGRALLVGGNPLEAIQKLEASVSLLREIGSPVNEIFPLIALARAELDLGRIARAQKHVEEALQSTEILRTQVATPDLRALFHSGYREVYGLYIDLLMALHRTAPTAGHDLEALAASESTRARALLDLLKEAGADIGRGVDTALVERRRFLERRLNAKAARRSRVLSGQFTLEQQQEVERDLSSALYELERVEARIRRRNPQYAALTQPRPLAANEIQALLDGDTVLLNYALGKERSFLWLVSSDQVESFELPARKVIEDTARRFHQLLSKPGAADREAQAMAASTLSDILLAPLGSQLDVNRLVVVADGALHYLPFGALPSPATDAVPLLVRHEVIYLPSASVLAEQRRRLAARDPPLGKLAVVADPIVDLRDPRLKGNEIADLPPKTTPMERGSRQQGPTVWKRLPGTRREAEAILALVPEGKGLAAIGFEANRATVMGADFGRHRVVHFATHGLIDTSNPQLSGLVLSLFDEAGQQREGFLRVFDVFNLDLAADLVVLSGCQTALGREVRGEGLLGLTRGFMYGGAPRVVASLWKVEDRATAELMSRFYHSMWVEGMTPAAALRSAQLSILRERRWKDPYYWSSFVMQGEWRATPTAN